VILHGLKAHVRMGHRAVGFLKALAKEHQTDLSGQRVDVIRDLIIDGVWKPAESFGFACRIDDTLVQARAASVNVVTNALSRRGASPHMRRKPFATASHDGAGLADGEGD
jgi:hypothetical protein